MSRGLLKTLTYSLMHLTVAIAVAYALTGNWTVALSIGLIEPFIQTIAYAVHERVWQRYIAGKGKRVPLIHGCSHTMNRIRDYVRKKAGAAGRDNLTPRPA